MCCLKRKVSAPERPKYSKAWCPLKLFIRKSYNHNQYKNTKNSIIPKNYPKSKTLRVLNKLDIEAMFTLYRIGFCSVSTVAPVQCEQELMFCCGAEIVPKRSQCEQKPYPLCNLQRSLLI